MTPGRLESIHIASRKTDPLDSLAAVRAIAGRGLEGDRYFDQAGTFSTEPGAGREVTLIEAEALEALARDYAIHLRPGESRRNLITRGVPLNHLVDREFSVGEVRMRGVRLCEPCGHLARLTGQKSMRGLTHRGGLRADIVRSGTLRVGDPIELAEDRSLPMNPLPENA